MFCSGSYVQLKPALEAVGASVAILEFQGQDFVFLVANRRYEEMVGLEPEALLGFTPGQVFSQEMAQIYREQIDHCLETRDATEVEISIDRDSGESWWRMVLSPILDAEGRVTRIFNTCIDISDKMRLEQALQVSHERFEAVIQSAYDGIISIDEQQRIRLVNKTAQEMFQVSEQEVLGESLNCLIPQRWHRDHRAFVESFQASAVTNRPMHTRQPVTGIRRDGSEFPCEVSLAKIHFDGRVEMTAVVRDVSEQSRLIEELQVLASTDSLTGLNNRRKMHEYIDEEIARVDRFGHPMSLIIFDIDHFKRINDTYGHPVGDKVIVAVADVARNQLRRTDKIGRVGGEEFLILLPETSAEQALVQAERLRRALDEFVVTVEAADDINVTASFGVIDLEESVSAVEELISKADIALYEAKKGGRNRVVRFAKV